MLRKFKVNVNGKSYLVELEEIGGSPAPVQPAKPAPVFVASSTSAPAPAAAPVAETRVPVPSSKGVTIEAPMPGNILALKVSVGDQVAFEQTVAVLEAMKMENELVAPKAGTVTAIYVKEGAPIDVGKPILTIE